jgi:acyl-CoA dehydrogenase family protein 9
MEAATERGVSSFAKSLFLGQIHEELVFPFPKPDPAEQDRIRELIASLREMPYDARRVEEERWLGDDTIAELGERGLMGLYVPEEYGGQGLSQTGYCRVSEVFAQIDATLSVVMGVHQSIGMKGIVLYGSDEQKERFLPDLASGRKLAAFALTEPNAGSDVASMETRAERQGDGSWRLDGLKHYIGNGSKAGVLVTFARTGEREHSAFILEQGMEGLEVGKRFDTMGLRGNDLRELRYNGIRVPAENVLGEPGHGFRVAMQILNNGRLSLGTGSVGGAKYLLDHTIRHVKERRQFGQPLADFELVQDKIGWAVSYLFGLESMAYLSTGLVDRGVDDYSLESAICKVAGTEFLWYAANRSLQLAGAVSEQVKRLRAVTEGLLREHRRGIVERQFHQKRLASAVSDIYAQVAVLSRVSAHLEEHGVEPSGQERYICDTFCRRAGARVKLALDQIERNDDERMIAIAKLAYKRGEYGYAFFED